MTKHQKIVNKAVLQLAGFLTEGKLLETKEVIEALEKIIAKLKIDE